MVYTKTINDNMISLPSFIEQNQCPNVFLNNQREITLILKRDKRKSISAEVNKKHFKELTKYKNPITRGGFRGGVRGVRPPKIRKAYVIQR